MLDTALETSLERNIPDFKDEKSLSLFLGNQNDRVYLLANKNNLKNLSDAVKRNLTVCYQYRPEEKTRSYILYEIIKKGDQHGRKEH